MLPLVPRYPFCFSFIYLFVLYVCENCTFRRWSINRLKASNISSLPRLTKISSGRHVNKPSQHCSSVQLRRTDSGSKFLWNSNKSCSHCFTLSVPVGGSYLRNWKRGRERDAVSDNREQLTFVSISSKHSFLNLSNRPRFFSLSTMLSTTFGSTDGRSISHKETKKHSSTKLFGSAGKTVSGMCSAIRSWNFLIAD